MKTITTFKSGEIKFTSEYNKKKLQVLFQKEEDFLRVINDLPIMPEEKKEFNERLMNECVFSLISLDGKNVDLEIIEDIFNNDNARPTKTDIDIEIENTIEAIEFIKEKYKLKPTTKLKEEFIVELYSYLITGFEQFESKAVYRNHKHKSITKNLDPGIEIPSYRADIELLMKEYINWINSKEIQSLNPVSRSMLALINFMYIQPFETQNHKMACLIAMFILQNAGYKDLAFALTYNFWKNNELYFGLMNEFLLSKPEDITKVIKFYHRAVCERLDFIYEQKLLTIKRLLFESYINNLNLNSIVNIRQLELLENLLYQNTPPFTLKNLFLVQPFRSLFKNVTDRTARRDIQKLLELKLIVIVNENEYKLNLNVL